MGTATATFCSHQFALRDYAISGQPELALFYYRDLNGDWSGPELETISGYIRS